MEKFIIDIIINNHAELCIKWKNELKEITEKNRFLEENLKLDSPVINDLFEKILDSLVEVDENSGLSEFYRRISMYDGSLDLIAQGFQAFRRVAIKKLINEDLTKQETIFIYNEIDKWFDLLMIRIINNCSENWEGIFNQQEETLKELSSPFIPLVEGIAVMPLIGKITEKRAMYFMENLLQGIGAYQSNIVFIDITGVPLVDSYVAQVIINSTRTAQMLGAECIIVGIRPEIAQTMIKLGVDIKQIKTYNSLSSGLSYAVKNGKVSNK